MKRIFAVWKPKGMTSHDVVDAVRRIISSPLMGEDKGGGGRVFGRVGAREGRGVYQGEGG